jgi:hypothetical protein
MMWSEDQPKVQWSERKWSAVWGREEEWVCMGKVYMGREMKWSAVQSREEGKMGPHGEANTSSKMVKSEGMGLNREWKMCEKINEKLCRVHSDLRVGYLCIFCIFFFLKLSCVYGCYWLVSNGSISGCLLSCVYLCNVFCLLCHLMSTCTIGLFWLPYVGLLYCGCIAVLL